MGAGMGRRGEASDTAVGERGQYRDEREGRWGWGVGGEYEKGARGEFGEKGCYMGEDGGCIEGKDSG